MRLLIVNIELESRKQRHRGFVPDKSGLGVAASVACDCQFAYP